MRTRLERVLHPTPSGKDNFFKNTLSLRESVFVHDLVTSTRTVNAERIAVNVYRDIGYTDPIDIIARVVKQSPDIAQGVDTGGAGDQGIMYGFATDETEEMLPRGVVLAHRITKGLQTLRRMNPLFSWIGPDGKAQVTFKGATLKTVLISTQHAKDKTHKEICDALRGWLFDEIIPEEDARAVALFVNPTGRFEIGGFAADAGLTGRKIMVDTYGGLAPHGGGAFSGKDPTKVDRSAAYYARWVAKHVVAHGLSKRCLISVAYAIGREEPLMVHAETEHGDDHDILRYVLERFDFRPRAMIEQLGLRTPIYRHTAAFGHFGRAEFPWERVS